MAASLENVGVPMPLPSGADSGPITAKWIVLVTLWALATFWRRKGPEDSESHRCSADDCQYRKREKLHRNDPSDTGPIPAQNGQSA